MNRKHHIHDQPEFCDCMIHPFLKDPGVSQHGRMSEALDVTKVKIDARSTADLLHYFRQLSAQINYYDAELKVSDWQPFFRKSIPFVLADIIRFDSRSLGAQLEKTKTLFYKSPGPQSLQYLQFFIVYNILQPLSNWYQQLESNELPIEKIFQNTLRDKVKPAFLHLLVLNQLGTKWFKTNTIDSVRLFSENNPPLVTAGEISSQGNTITKTFRFLSEMERLNLLFTETSNTFNLLITPIRLLGRAAEMSIDQSLFNLKANLDKTHAPHLALMFAFIKLFQILQGDLNQFTRKHLDYFYKDVLKFVAASSVPDSAHIVLGIQKELRNYLLEKGLLLNGGTDLNKEDILFALDDEIVINHVQVREVRTLFINNNKVGVDEQKLTEGLYIAPNARLADGISKEFETDLKNFYTVGNRESKYMVPGTTIFQPYPAARIGFVLASPVLMLKEATRTVTITLECSYDANVCPTETDSSKSPGCCEDQVISGAEQIVNKALLLSAVSIVPKSERKKKDQSSIDQINFSQIHNYINQDYYYLSQDLIAEAVKKGLDQSIANELSKFLDKTDKTKTRGEDYCYCPEEKTIYDTVVIAADFESAVPSNNEIIQKFFQKKKPFSLQFSGEKGWIDPDATEFTINEKSPNSFEFVIKAELLPEKDPVTFFNPDALKEELDTTLPVVKIMLDNHFKLPYEHPGESIDHCLDQPMGKSFTFSLYHLFRHVRVEPESRIDVMVCGLRNFVVQNDESLQNVNGPIYPFGSRPDILDYSVINSGGAYQMSQAFLDNNLKTKVTESTFSKLENFISSNPVKKKRVTIAATEEEFNDFLDSLNISNADRNAIRNEYASVTEKINKLNLVGPSFYIGSTEAFGKKWNEVRVNYNWKDRPNSFNDYYNGYLSRVDPDDPSKQIYGLDEDGFEINLSLMENGAWKPESLHENGGDVCPEDTFPNTFTKGHNRLLFPKLSEGGNCAVPFCNSPIPFTESLYIRNDFIANHHSTFLERMNEVTSLNVNTRDAFLRINLQNQDFLHKDYPYILARQMLASGKLPGDAVEDAIYYDTNGDPVVIDSDQLLAKYSDANDLAGDVNSQVNIVHSKLGNDGDPIAIGEADDIRDTIKDPGNGLKKNSEELKTKLQEGVNSLEGLKKFSAIIPNEPWTPIISSISIDYTATAALEDIDLIHLYPFESTYKHEQIDSRPTLLPTHCNEGNLFIGLEKLIPPSNLTLLFQLAEATADSELSAQPLRWHYLDRNVWRLLRTGFEITEDETKNLTSTGVIKFSLPANISTDHTIMTKGLHWIRASIAGNSRTISETVGIFSQAVKVTFTNTNLNDKTRLQRPFEAGQISKLEVADANVNQVLQPFAGFGGMVSEDQDKFYIRVSEHLRHKGRSIQKFDYERIVLQAFPQIFRAKCISHSIGLDANDFRLDFPYAPGFIILGVIPDLTKLKAGNSFEPKVPLSLLEEIDAYFSRTTSPFVRIRTMNPRYERIHLCVKVRLMPGKDEGYYKARMVDDLRRYFAPWTIGEEYHYKLSFGQCVNPGNVISFIESLGYVDFLLEIKLRLDSGKPIGNIEICPSTARSILVAGDIEVCIDRPKAEQWCESETCSATPLKINPCNPAYDRNDL